MGKIRLGVREAFFELGDGLFEASLLFISPTQDLARESQYPVENKGR